MPRRLAPNPGTSLLGPRAVGPGGCWVPRGHVRRPGGLLRRPAHRPRPLPVGTWVVGRGGCPPPVLPAAEAQPCAHAQQGWSQARAPWACRRLRHPSATLLPAEPAAQAAPALRGGAATAGGWTATETCWLSWHHTAGGRLDTSRGRWVHAGFSWVSALPQGSGDGRAAPAQRGATLCCAPRSQRAQRCTACGAGAALPGPARCAPWPHSATPCCRCPPAPADEPAGRQRAAADGGGAPAGRLVCFVRGV